MSFSGGTKQHVKQVATESLDMLTKVAEIASDLRRHKGLGVDSFASVNTLNTIAASQSLAQVNHANQESNQILSDEPAIARVVVLTPSGNERVYYICRATPVTGELGECSMHQGCQLLFGCFFAGIHLGIHKLVFRQALPLAPILVRLGPK